MNNGVSCIGRIGGGDGDWFAELDFDAGEATVLARTARGPSEHVATVPLGQVWPEDEEHYAELMDDTQNRRLMMVVFAPELARATVRILNEADAMYAVLADVLKAEPKANPETLRNAVWDAMSVLGDIVNECVRANEATEVPKPDNPSHADSLLARKRETP